MDSFLYIFDAIIRGSHAHVDDIMWVRIMHIHTIVGVFGGKLRASPGLVMTKLNR